MTAPPVERVPSWLREELPALLGLTTALTGSPNRAAELVAATISRARSRLRRMEEPDLADDELLTLVVRDYLRRATRHRSPGATGLDALEPRARAAVVLRDGARLTTRQIASVLDRPITQVSGDLAVASSTYGPEIAALAATAPAVDEVLSRVTAAGRRRRIRQSRGLALGVALFLVAGLAVALPTVLLPRLPAEVRAPGQWRFSHEVRPPPGWTVLSRVLRLESESTQLERPLGGASGSGGCLVTVYTAGAYPVQSRTRLEEMRVRGRPGFVGQNATDDFVLAWEYGERSWAEVTCLTLRLDVDELSLIAAAVRFRASAVLVPFTLTALPEGYQVRSLTEYRSTNGIEIQIAKTDIVPGEVDLVVAAPLNQIRPEPSRGEVIRVDGYPGRLTGGTDPRLCINVGSNALCLLTFWPGGDWPAPAPYPYRADDTLTDLAGRLHLAPDLRDPDTWFDAEVALPG